MTNPTPRTQACRKLTTRKPTTRKPTTRLG